MVDQGLPADTIYFDFQKAFDKVSHGRFLLKLKANGFGGRVLDYIEDWLKD